MGAAEAASGIERIFRRGARLCDLGASIAFRKKYDTQ